MHSKKQVSKKNKNMSLSLEEILLKKQKITLVGLKQHIRKLEFMVLHKNGKIMNLEKRVKDLEKEKRELQYKLLQLRASDSDTDDELWEFNTTDDALLDLLIDSFK